MQQQVAWAMGKPGMEESLLSHESDTQAYYGRLQKARELSRRAADTARRNGNKESAALEQVDTAEWEAYFGNAAQARQVANGALALSPGRDVQLSAARVLATAGDAAQTQMLVDKLNKEFPRYTMIQGCWLPTIRAEMELNRGNAAKAIKLLQATSPYELGGRLYPAYARGLAYLRLRQGGAAITEFQRILDHCGLMGNSPLGALAHLQLGKAYAMSGDTVKARTAYQDFLALWKDADPTRHCAHALAKSWTTWPTCRP